MGVSLPPQMTLHYFAETAQSCLLQAPSATSGCADSMSKKAVFVDRLGNVEYSFAVSNHLSDEMEVS